MYRERIPCIGGPRHGKRQLTDSDAPNNTVVVVEAESYRIVKMRSVWNGEPKVHSVLVWASLPSNVNPFELLIEGFR